MEDELYGGLTKATVTEGSLDAALYEGLFVGPSSSGSHEAYLQHKVNELEEMLNVRNAEVQVLKRQLRDRDQQVSDLTTDRNVLLRNMSCLYKTAKEEMARKQTEMYSLRAEIAQTKHLYEQRRPHGYQLPPPPLRPDSDVTHMAGQALVCPPGTKRNRDPDTEVDTIRPGIMHSSDRLRSSAEDAGAKRPRGHSIRALPAMETKKLDNGMIAGATVQGVVVLEQAASAGRAYFSTDSGAAVDPVAASKPSTTSALWKASCPGNASVSRHPSSCGRGPDVMQYTEQQQQQQHSQRQHNPNNARIWENSRAGPRVSPDGLYAGVPGSDHSGGSHWTGLPSKGPEDQYERESSRGADGDRQRLCNNPCDMRSQHVAYGSERSDGGGVRRNDGHVYSCEGDGPGVAKARDGVAGGGEGSKDPSGEQCGRHDNSSDGHVRDLRWCERLRGEEGWRGRERQGDRECARADLSQDEHRRDVLRGSERQGGGEVWRDRGWERGKDGANKVGGRSGVRDRRGDELERGH